MKTSIAIVWALVNFSVLAEPVNSFLKLNDRETLRLSYVPNAPKEDIACSLFLQSGNEETAVTSELAKHQIDANGMYRLYEECSLVAADYQSDRLLVLYAYGAGVQQLVRADHSVLSYAPRITADKDLLMVLYRKEQNAWRKVVSIYVQRLWGEIYGEQITGVRLNGKQRCEVKFNRKWKIEGAKELLEDNRSKTYSPDGSDTKTLEFDSESKLILAIDADGSKSITDNMRYWFGPNDEHIKAIGERNSVLSRTESEARKKGETLPDRRKEAFERNRKMGIEVRKLVYFPETSSVKNHQRSNNKPSNTKDPANARPTEK